MIAKMKQTLYILTSLFAFGLGSTNLKAADKDIVDTAVAAGDFKILAKALQHTGLDKALKGEGPFTVFAPNDKAFMRLPKGTLEMLLQPENKEQLAKILTYHVVSGNVEAATAVTLKEANTLNGEKVNIQFKNAALYLNKSRVLATDIKASNGVIHVIDNVLIPKDLKYTNRAKKASKSNASVEILTGAIEVGVDLFNADNAKACASVYKIAVMAVLEIKPKSLNKDDFANLKRALAEVETSDDHRANAWALRRVMNTVLGKLEK